MVPSKVEAALAHAMMLGHLEGLFDNFHRLLLLRFHAEILQRTAAARAGVVAILQDPIDLILRKRLPLMPLVSGLSANLPFLPTSRPLPLRRWVGNVARRRLGRSRRVLLRLRKLISKRCQLLLQLRYATGKLLALFASRRFTIVHDAGILTDKPKSTDSNFNGRERLPAPFLFFSYLSAVERRRNATLRCPETPKVL